ncbi:MAG: N-acyl homoserine lactonase family protein, partial [Xanthobacteraceae bacterium]
MKPYMLVFVCTALPALLSGANGALAQSDKSGVERLYVLNCGRGHAADQSLWSPGVNVGTAIDVSDNCYLIKHKQGWFLWDTGVPDAVAAMPDGLPPSNPRASAWRRPKTLASQLDQLGVK